MPEPLVDTSAQAQTAAPANTSLQSDIPVEASTSALDKAKAEFEAFVAFVEHGIEVLGANAETELVALKDKYL
ncbi:Ig domain-containing protein [Serratia sp. M24T3]|uniref:Ig domain-containing protein n=1 Tax=Serratia sp. M24T3 TaxID=932213 RepID=UPI00025BAB24|nr:Ig domain-containing protein [Serratia sp. M24T3]EIC82094.1 Ig domain protein group 1 domain protein [Serratia sp. M24T3]